MGSNGEPEHSLMIEGSPTNSMQIDPKRSREDGVILDFAGPNFVCVDNFTFGSPARYVQLSKEQCCIFFDSSAHDCDNEVKECGGRSNAETWDDALHKSTQEFQHQSYNLFTCNCHSFVANCLNMLKFQTGGWNVVNLAILVFLKGQWVSNVAILRTYLPFLFVVGLGLIFGGATFLAYLAIFIFILVGWFLIGTYCLRKAIYL